MQYLNVLLESLDDENQAYFYGERLVIDYMDIIGFINRASH